LGDVGAELLPVASIMSNVFGGLQPHWGFDSVVDPNAPVARRQFGKGNTNEKAPDELAELLKSEYEVVLAACNGVGPATGVPYLDVLARTNNVAKEAD
jgi:hypothetical protein